MSLTINRQQNGASLTITLVGRLDATTAPSLDAELQNLPGTANELISGCGALAYVSSAGLRSFVNAFRKMSKSGGGIKVIHVNDVVRGTLELSGLTGGLNVD